MPGPATDEHPLRRPAAVEELFLYRLHRLSMIARQPVIQLCEREFGITRREWRILALLARQDGINPSTLAERALLDRARTSRAVGSLAAKGLVARVRAPADGREARLHLTEAGRRAHKRLMPRIAAINRELLSVLGDDELAVLDVALARLTAQAQAQAGDAAGQNGMSSSMSSNPVDDF